MKLFSKQPKVSCPKCKTLHQINPESTCPVCGAKYKLPDEILEKYSNAKKHTDESIFSKVTKAAKKKLSKFTRKYDNLNGKTKRLIKLCSALAAFFAIFLVIIMVCFTDKEPALYKVGEVKNQPNFYYTTDDSLNCLFDNGKTVCIGTGLLRDYVSSAGGKEVYVSFSGALCGKAAESSSNYILKIKNYKDVSVVTENADYVPSMLAGGDCNYLYIAIPVNTQDNLSNLYLSKGGKEPVLISEEVKDICISPNGRHALFSIYDSGATKLMEYSAASGDITNPGIKNSYPLSIDNKGEYLIYAKKIDETNMNIISERSTSERIELPLLPESHLERIVFSEDRRSIAIGYSDRTTFYSCGSDSYSTVLTYNGSVFGKNLNRSANYNLLSTAQIPEIQNTHGASLLPYFFFDKDRQGIYCVEKDGSKVPVFDRTFDSVKVSENGYVAFVSDGKLYSGKLDHRSNELCELMDFQGKTLVDITPDGKKICYTDNDGNLFTVKYGKKNDTPAKIFVDPDFVKFSSDGKTILVSGDNVASFIKGDNVTNLCEGLLPEETRAVKKDLSKIIFAKSEYENGVKTDKKGLYLYSKGKAQLITDNLKSLIVKETERIDRSLSYYTDVYAPVFAFDAEAVN